jgi:two-component system response regulator RegA
MDVVSTQKHFLIVDDDKVFCEVVTLALKKRGFSVSIASNAKEAIKIAKDRFPDFALVDLKMPGDTGLVLIRNLKSISALTRVVLLTGYASISTAIEAIRAGACHYLVKPADIDEIISAFNKTEGDIDVPISQNPMTVNRLEWEYIQKVLSENSGNISATAKALNMHRRTLQRKLSKVPREQLSWD